jgi:hypothetical protein
MRITFDKLLIVFYALLSTGCGPLHYTANDFDGEYVQTLQNGMKLGPVLDLANGNFILRDAHRYAEGVPYICCDTMAQGTWRFDNGHGLLVLNTNNSTTPVLDINVKESASGNADSLYFYITSPIGRSTGKRYEGIVYNLVLHSMQLSDDPSAPSSAKFDDFISGKLFDTNKVVIANPNHFSVRSFTLNISPTPFFRGSHVAVAILRTVTYNVDNYKSSNVFFVDVPGLVYSQITDLRLSDDFVKVISRNKLEWDGKYYIRKDKNVDLQ